MKKGVNNKMSYNTFPPNPFPPNSENVGNGGVDPYVLPIATSEILGGVKVGNGLSINENGVLSAKKFTFGTYSGTTSANGVLTPLPSIGVEENFIIGAYGNGSYVVTPFVASSDNTWRFMVLQSSNMSPLSSDSATINYVVINKDTESEE